jgi:RNA polymerase sigma-70 factor (ECF subfamily)
VSPRAPGPTPDLLLDRRIRDGDSSAEDELVSRFSRPVFVMLLARLGDVEAARDLAQDVLLSVLRALRDGKLEQPERLAAFVRGTAKNLANNYLRTQQRRRIRGETDWQSSDPDPEFRLEQREEAKLVEIALRDLASRDRKILLWTLVDGRSATEVAARLGMSPGAVRQRKSRALGRIRRRFRKLSRKGPWSHSR